LHAEVTGKNGRENATSRRGKRETERREAETAEADEQSTAGEQAVRGEHSLSMKKLVAVR
jgi:hypothetical protein